MQRLSRHVNVAHVIECILACNLQNKFYVNQFDLLTTAATNGQYEGSKLHVDEIK